MDFDGEDAKRAFGLKKDFKVAFINEDIPNGKRKTLMISYKSYQFNYDQVIQIIKIIIGETEKGLEDEREKEKKD